MLYTVDIDESPCRFSGLDKNLVWKNTEQRHRLSGIWMVYAESIGREQMKSIVKALDITFMVFAGLIAVIWVYALGTLIFKPYLYAGTPLHWFTLPLWMTLFLLVLELLIGTAAHFLRKKAEALEAQKLVEEAEKKEKKAIPARTGLRTAAGLVRRSRRRRYY